MASSDHVDASLIDQLLYGSEGIDLDFKRDQYPFQGASDLEKAELLKDILAFANAFRRNTAFILIGVEEVDCGRARVVGVSDHLKDADLQQFVSTKTNRNVVFSYHALEFEGKQIGVIRVQDQQRPIFLKNDFGFDHTRKQHKLKANVVYFRVGSSTKEASPEDIAHMGNHGAGRPTYNIDLQFANFSEKTVAGSVLKTSNEFLLYESKIPDYAAPRRSSPAYEIVARSTAFDNHAFWREAYNYIKHWKSLTEIGFCIENRGDTTIDDVTVEISLPIDAGFALVAKENMPEKPKPQYSTIGAARLPKLPVRASNIRVERRGNQQVITLLFGKVQAGQRRFLADPLYIGNPGEGHVIVDAVVRADQFPAPLRARLEFHGGGTVTTVNWNGLRRLIEEYFFGKMPDAPHNGAR